MSSNRPIWTSDFDKTIYLNLAFLITSIFYYGAYTILICFAVPMLISDRNGNRVAKRGLLVAVLAMFTISTYSVVVQAAHMVLSLKTVFAGELDEEAMDSFIEEIHIAFGVERVLRFLNVLIGDFLFVWRTWALWPGNLKVVIIPSILFFGVVVSTVTTWVCHGRHISSMDLTMDVPQCSKSVWAAYSLSAATNLAATIAIGYKAWLHGRAHRKYLGAGTTTRASGLRTLAERIVTLVLIFGAVHCCLWIVGLFVSIAFGNPHAAFPLQLIYYCIRAVSRHIVGMNATLLIVVVRAKKSTWDKEWTLELDLETESARDDNRTGDTGYATDASAP
ncbi:hypothetical protein VNI00_010147 [Paramarasmius palmivorus]|uniref:Taste receptor type 2 n=1 Tax=Paramarasmius palmivorus TaxID=297713 RepID=A0AAW0CL62_9AGAR